METKLAYWHRKWLRYRTARRVALAAAIVLPLMVFGRIYWHWSWYWMIPAAALFTAALILYGRSLKTGRAEFARYLNAEYPQLEESAALALQTAAPGSLLAQLQRERVLHTLQGLDEPPVIGSNLRRLLLTLLIGAGALTLASWLPGVLQRTVVNDTVQINGKTVKDRIPPSIKEIRLSIIPPAYTGKPRRMQRQFSMQVEDGARVSWEIETTLKVRELFFLVNDKQRILLQPTDGDSTRWTASAVITAPGFYQVQLDGKRSDLYQIEVLRDQPAVIKINTPKPYVQIGYGEEKKVSLAGFIHDDYGLRSSFIHATIASGRGEGVSFREKNLALGGSGGPQFNFSRVLDLDALNMQPGDELYFYIQATDTRGHVTKSDAYTVLIKDTTELMSMEGLISGVNLMPEYFRSQRQIIIDTEKLLKEQGSISKEEFQNRSNSLGIDQKLLRLRYGKFLGEEAETNIGDAGHDPDHEGHEQESAADPKDFNNAEKIIDDVAHKHDQAEDATFFDAATKSQLKATLTEMWKSELRLRTFKPREALPFEYKALQLLKDLQQQSRAYVAKTLYKAPPFMPDKRMSGDLDKVISPVFSRKAPQPDPDLSRLQRLASAVQGLHTGKPLPAASRPDMEYLAAILGRQAQRNPSAYLPSVRAARSILSAKAVSAADLRTLQLGLQKLLPVLSKSPQKREAGSAGSLSDAYFKNLGRAGY